MLAIPHKRQLADGYCLPACVEMVMAYWGDLNFAHALVVAAMTKETVWVHDPDQDHAPITVSLGNFALAWDAMGNLYGTIRRK